MGKGLVGGTHRGKRGRGKFKGGEEKVKNRAKLDRTGTGIS